MSQENVERFIELTRAFNRLIAAVEAYDPGDLRDWLDYMDPEIEFTPQQAELTGGYVGQEGARQWLADIAAHYGPGGHIRFGEFRDLGDRVLGLGTLHFIGRGSGIETEVPVAIMATFRNGLITQRLRRREPGAQRRRAVGVVA